MDIELKIDSNLKEPKIVIYTDKVTEDISHIIDNINGISQKNLKVFKNEKMYILKQDEIETIYTENGKIFVRANNEIYTAKSRLYELEMMLDNKIFARISNSEIVNFDKVENIDFRILGTLELNFKNGNKSYVSRRYIQKIKEFLEI